MKLLNLLNEVRYKTVLNKLSPNRKEPKAIVALRIKRVERGGSEAEINVTPDELIDIFRSNDFPARYRTSNYVYQVEMKKSKNNKRVAIVNIFNADNLPDDIKLNEPADFDLNGAKVYLMTPDAVRYRKDSTTTAAPTTTTSTTTVPTTTTSTTTTAGNNSSDQTTKIVPPGTPLLKRGSRGESVKQLQTLLGLTGDSVDGKFGVETSSWLTIWQDEHNLSADGIYGPNTAAAMKNDMVVVKDQARAKRLTIALRNADKQIKQTKRSDLLLKALKASGVVPHAAESTAVAGMNHNDIALRYQINPDAVTTDISKFFTK